MSSELPRTLVNGESRNTLAVSDRGFAYGQGVFETIRICNGQPTLWQQHLLRLQQGCQRLAIVLPSDIEQLLRQDVDSLCQAGEEGVIKVIVTAGSGGRGYAAPEAMQAQRIVSLFPLPNYPAARSEQGIRVITCNYRLPLNPQLAGIKHLNRLDQVLARAEWQDSAIAEGIVLDVNGQVIEGTMSNLFAVQDGVLITPVLEQAGVRGVMRGFILDTAQTMGLESREVSLGADEFKNADEVFISNSVIGLWPVLEWDAVRFSKGPVTSALLARIEPLFNGATQ